MSEDGTTFTIDLPVTGQAAIDAASASMDTLAVQLEKAGKASEAASAAVTAGEAAYRRAQASADATAKAIERIGVTAQAQRGKLQAAMDAGDDKGAAKAAATLQNLVAREGELQTKATAAKTALDAQAAALDKVQQEATKAAAEEKKLQDETDKLKPPAKDPLPGGDEEGGGEFRFEGLARGLKKLGGPLGDSGAKVAELGGAWGKLSKSLGSAAPFAVAAVGIVAVIGVVVELTVKIGEAILKFAEWAVQLADANRSALLLSEGIAKSVAGGTLLNGEIDKLTKTMPFTQQELSDMASKLAESGLKGQALADALDKTAIAAAKAKFGPDWQAQMLSLSEQSKVLQFNLSQIFGGLKLDGLLTALQHMIGLLDASSASGKAIKVVFESLFQPIIDGVTGALPKVERFFLQLEIWALKSMIFLKQHWSTIKLIGEAFLVVAAIIVGVLVVAFGVLIAIMAVPFVILAALVVAIKWVVDELIKGWQAVAAFFKGLNLGDMGKNLIDGLINGIKSGATAVINAMKGVVTGAIDAAKKALGIASPSKVFAEIGVQTGAGMEQGVNKGGAAVRDSLETMVAPPAGKPGGPGAQAPKPEGGSSKGGHNFSGAQFIFNGVKDAQDAVAQFEEMLTRAIEGDLTKLGGAKPATT